MIFSGEFDKGEGCILVCLIYECEIFVQLIYFFFVIIKYLKNKV